MARAEHPGRTWSCQTTANIEPSFFILRLDAEKRKQDVCLHYSNFTNLAHVAITSIETTPFSN
jgi:hypothetical protein